MKLNWNKFSHHHFIFPTACYFCLYITFSSIILQNNPTRSFPIFLRNNFYSNLGINCSSYLGKKELNDHMPCIFVNIAIPIARFFHLNSISFCTSCSISSGVFLRLGSLREGSGKYSWGFNNFLLNPSIHLSLFNTKSFTRKTIIGTIDDTMKMNIINLAQEGYSIFAMDPLIPFASDEKSTYKNEHIWSNDTNYWQKGAQKIF